MWNRIRFLKKIEKEKKKNLVFSTHIREINYSHYHIIIGEAFKSTFMWDETINDDQDVILSHSNYSWAENAKGGYFIKQITKNVNL